MSYLQDWPLPKLKALHRVAKNTGFFKHPRSMMYLRDLIKEKENA
jgi:hypothetical protein